MKNCGTTDIVFVFPPAHGNRGTFRPHLGVAYLRAALAPTGITTEQYCSDRPGTIGDVTNDILARKPGIVGFTVYDSNYHTALAIASSIKSQKPSVIVVFGGPTVTFSATDILKRTRVIDACILGEAEETGPKLLGSLLGGVELVEVTPGLAYRRRDDIVCGPLPPLVGFCGSAAECSLDTTPSPYLSGILSDGRAGVLTARGCTHHCQYCSFAALGRKTLRLHSIERVLAELEAIAHTQRRHRRRTVIPIHDDTFTLLVPRAKALCQALIERRLGLSLSCITRADSVDDELLRLLREAGFVNIAFGLESAVPEVLRAAGKVRPPHWSDPSLSPEKEFVRKVRASVVAAKKRGFHVGVSIILGLPAETPERGVDTLRFVRNLPIDYYVHNYLWIFPGTPLWDSAREYGLDCALDEFGLASTRKYAYDVNSLKPLARCSLEVSAKIVRSLTAGAMFSCAVCHQIGGGTGAIVLEGTELTPALAAWARGVLDIGGLMMHVLPHLRRGLQEQQVARDRLLLARELVPARYYVHLLTKRSRPMTDRWLVTSTTVGTMAAHKPHLLLLSATSSPEPLQKWLEGRAFNADFCELDGYLAHPGEIKKFLRRRGGLPASMQEMPVPPEIKYVGRWLKGRAPCRSLSRLEVDSAGCVRCCRHGDPIGVVGDSRLKLLRRHSILRRRIEARRGCGSCSSRHCPRCPFPGLPDKTYCSMMKSQAPVLEFLSGLHIYSQFPLLLARVEDRLSEV